MSTVQIDLNVLTQAITAAVQAALQTSTKQAEEAPEEQPRKRSRPKTVKKVVGRKTVEIPIESLADHTEFVSVEEEVLEVVNEQQPVRMPNQKNAHLFAAKRVTNSGQDVRQQWEDITDNRKTLKFVDIENVGDRIPSYKYPERSEPRPPAKLIKFTCTNCHQPFEDYPSNQQQAFFKVAGSAGQEKQDSCLVIKCPKCSTR